MLEMSAIRPMDSADLATVRLLFQEYADSLGVDLCFQDFETELATLPGAYRPPSGALLLAERGGEAAGCVAMRPLEPPAVAELKRLYVRPYARGAGVGVALTEAALELAREAGYARIRLDTLPTMAAAQALYRRLGFREIAPYRANPIPGALYMECDLARAAQRRD
jgi:ribosomal protein S18 acetylase RimI-like enzyme